MGANWAIWSVFLLYGCASTSKDSVEVASVDQPPFVEILSPVGTEHFYADRRIELIVFASDREDPLERLNVRWSSTVSGALSAGMESVGGGEMLGSVSLSAGDHLLRVEVTDTAGQVSFDELSMSVGPPNLPPNCTITAPEDGAAGSPGSLVTLTAAISDPDVGAEFLSAEWASTIDGFLGTTVVNSDGAAVMPIDTLSVGNHTIQLIARDELEGMCVDTSVYTVGNGPDVTIVGPADGDVVQDGASVDFVGRVSDSIDAAGDLNIQWRSNVDGLLNDHPADFDGSMDFQMSALSLGHHTITLFARNSAGMSNDETVTLTVNGLPSQPDVQILPVPANSSQSLMANIVDGGASVDPEGSEVGYRYTWFQNGVEVEDGDVANIDATATARDDVWRVVVTPSDEFAEGPPAEAEILINNTPPEILGVLLEPSDAVTTVDVSCTPSGVSDWDGTEPTISFSWFIDGEAVTETTGILSHEMIARGQEVYCEVTPADDVESGETVRSNVLTVENSPPSLTAAFINPEAVRAGDTPSCEWPDSAFVDPDGDGDASVITWYVNGELSGEGAVAEGDYVRGDVLTCTVIPSDGSADGDPISVSVDVLNTPPTLVSVDMFPFPAAVGDMISCTALGFYDVDGDIGSYRVQWDINGGVWATSGSITGGFFGGDVVSCTAIPNDGYDDGLGITRSQAIDNSPPSIASVSIAPNPPTAADTVTCTYTGFSDDDGDPDMSQRKWLVNGSEQVETGEHLSGVFGAGDTITCEVTPHDGFQEGTMRSHSVLVANAPPEIASVFFTPGFVYTDDTVQANANGVDADGDLISYHYVWTVNDVPVGIDERTLDGDLYFVRGQTIMVTVTPWDGHGPGTPYLAGPIMVTNSAPVGLEVTVDPEFPDEGAHDLVCQVDVSATDADGDLVIYGVEWFRDGVQFEDTIDTALSGDTVAGTWTAAGEEWTCEMTASDGDREGETEASSVYVAGWLGRLEDQPATSCLQILDQNPGAANGIYYLQPGSETIEGYCDMTTDEGGWTLVAYAPSNMGAPSAFGTGESYERDNCVAFSGFCRFSDGEINEILSYESADTDDRFRLLAPSLPGHGNYYWDTDYHFSSFSTPAPFSWWQVAVEYGGAHSPGCGHTGSRGAGHDPTDGACSASDTFGTGGVTDRIFFVSADGAVVGSSSYSTFSWYAR
jgi:hypothetical protein